MKSIGLIVPYFGTLPKQRFQLTLESCKRNNTIDWILITDDKTDYKYPKNVKVVYQTWAEFVQFVKDNIYRRLRIKVEIDRPYKLTDYKPLYGDLFQRYLSAYDFWGYTDISDIIYGNLRKYFVESDLEQFEKLNFLGHLTIFKNTKEVNERYKLPMNGNISIEDILSSPENFAFDESQRDSIHRIYLDNNFPFKRIDEMVADVSPLRFAFQLSKFDNNYQQYYEPFIETIFSYEQGSLFEWQIKNNNYIISKEIGYMHFQKRMLNSKIKTYNGSFIITPYGFIDQQNIDLKLIKKSSPRKIYIPFFKLKWRALLKKIKKN